MKTQNRKEIFLKALANGEEPNIKPLTREELLLKKQAERESASGGASGGGGAFVVNVIAHETDNPEEMYTFDKSFSEIYNALNSNKNVIFQEVHGDEEYKEIKNWYVTSWGSEEMEIVSANINGGGAFFLVINFSTYDGTDSTYTVPCMLQAQTES